MEYDDEYYNEIQRQVDRDLETAYRGCFFTGIGLLALAIIAALALSSCKSVEYVPVIEHHTDTTYITKHQRDSIYLHDSVSVKQQGDTIWVERWHTRYSEKQVHDTIREATHDTIPRPYAVIEYEAKPLTKWQRTLQNLGWAMLAVIVAGIFILISKIKKKL